MKSALTSTSLRSGFLYLIFLSLVVFATIYLLFYKSSSVQDNLNQHAFKLNYSAFSNGIKFANYRFMANRASDNNNERFDQWVTNQVGLDYNQQGFPIGTNITDRELQRPKESIDCLQLWNFVLGPLKPEISLSQKRTEYWVSLNSNGDCEFRSEKVSQLLVKYNSDSGKVTLIENIL